MAEMMLTKTLTSVLYMFYSVAFTVIGKFIKLLIPFSPKLKAQLTDRPSVSELATNLQRKRKNFKDAVLFFCSSAGEYEQARPLIDRLVNEKIFVHTLIFSKSGYDYAAARKDDVSYSLSPATDSVWDWGWLFAAVRPSIIAVVRHELWPGFIWSANNYGKLMLIDASRSIGEAKSKHKKKVRATLLGMFDKIYAVSEQDAEFFRQVYRLDRKKITVSGDTKYDRVLERTQANLGSHSQLKALLPKIGRRLIFGSAHPADLDCLLNATKLDPNLLRDWQIVIAPHHIDAANIKLFQTKLSDANIDSVIFTSSNETPVEDNKVLILDTMGMLAEAYSFGTAAFVGGATHYQVHNVLEPAVHGLNLAWGPKYENSQEAIQLVENKIAQVIHSPAELKAWLINIGAKESDNGKGTANAVGSLKGASDLIFKDWKTILNG